MIRIKQAELTTALLITVSICTFAKSFTPRRIVYHTAAAPTIYVGEVMIEFLNELTPNTRIQQEFPRIQELTSHLCENHFTLSYPLEHLTLYTADITEEVLLCLYIFKTKAEVTQCAPSFAPSNQHQSHERILLILKRSVFTPIEHLSNNELQTPSLVKEYIYILSSLLSYKDTCPFIIYIEYQREMDAFVYSDPTNTTTQLNKSLATSFNQTSPLTSASTSHYIRKTRKSEISGMENSPIYRPMFRPAPEQSRISLDYERIIKLVIKLFTIIAVLFVVYAIFYTVRSENLGRLNKECMNPYKHAHMLAQVLESIPDRISNKYSEPSRAESRPTKHNIETEPGVQDNIPSVSDLILRMQRINSRNIQLNQPTIELQPSVSEGENIEYQHTAPQQAFDFELYNLPDIDGELPPLSREEEELREVERKLGWSTRENVHDTAITAYMDFIANQTKSQNTHETTSIDQLIAEIPDSRKESVNKGIKAIYESESERFGMSEPEVLQSAIATYEGGGDREALLEAIEECGDVCSTGRLARLLDYIGSSKGLYPIPDSQVKPRLNELLSEVRDGSVSSEEYIAETNKFKDMKLISLAEHAEYIDSLEWI